MRLNKFLATNTGISRREADKLIEQGKVLINDEKAVLGTKITSGDEIIMDGHPVVENTASVTIILNKPVGYLSSRRSQGGDPTVYDLLPPELQTLKTAGRLDRDSSGLMIMSSDGDLIQRLTHPSYEKVKIYKIELDKPLEPLHQQMISDFGIDLPDGKSRLDLTSNVKSLTSNWTVTMHEGRNRQIRRTFSALGYTVTKLHRTDMGNYHLDDLESGKYKKLPGGSLQNTDQSVESAP